MKDSFSFIIQARSKSTRLPGKILLPFSGQLTILDIQLNNLQAYFPESTIIIATTVNKADDAIAEKYLANKKLKVFRGDEDNVLKRFIDAAKANNTENIVRICSDNPFLSIPYLFQLIHCFFEASPDYVSYLFNNGTPSIKSHSGLFAEMMSLRALEKVQQLTQESLYLEHVTNYMYTNKDKFKLDFILVPDILNSYFDKLRLTVDTERDFISLQKLYLALLNKYGLNYTLEQLLSEVDKDSELLTSMDEQIKQHAK